MLGDGGHRVHVRLGNVLDDDGNVIVPSADSLVVRSGQESPVLIDKSDGVDSA